MSLFLRLVFLYSCLTLLFSGCLDPAQANSKFVIRGQKKCNIAFSSSINFRLGDALTVTFVDRSEGSAEITKIARNRLYRARILSGQNCMKQASGLRLTTEDGPNDTSTQALRSRTLINMNAGYGLPAEPLHGPEFELGTNLWEYGQLGLSYSLGTYSNDGIGDKKFRVDGFNVSAHFISLKYRQYLFNSFNIAVSVGYRFLGMDAQVIDVATDDRLAFELETDALGIGLSLGNRWASSFGLTWGFDWIGYFVPIGYQWNSYFSASGAAALEATEIQSALLTLGQKLGTKETLSVAFLMGWQL